MASAAPEIPVLARDQAFENLYRQYVKDVYHYALALLRNPADAEDVTQTTFMNAYRAFKRGDEIQKPQNWLIKIAHNVARTRYARASRRVKEVPLEDHVEQLALPEEERPNIEGVLHALGRLPFNQRAALVMRELEGRTYAEIADTLGVSVPAVETLIFRARRSLRLRASALRTLSVVPLPGSLAQLFESGAVTGGGGALVGMGFLVKAMIAIVAGAVATGVGGGGTGPATAAPPPSASLAISPPWAGGNGLMLRLRTGRVQPANLASRQGSPIESARGSGSAGEVTAREDIGNSVSRADAGTPEPTSTRERVKGLVGSTASTLADTAASATSPLPVQAPSLPPAQVPNPPAVQIPSPPPVNVPSPPPVPTLPPVPVHVPPPPPPPKLP